MEVTPGSCREPSLSHCLFRLPYTGEIAEVGMHKKDLRKTDLASLLGHGYALPAGQMAVDSSFALTMNLTLDNRNGQRVNKEPFHQLNSFSSTHFSIPTPQCALGCCGMLVKVTFCLELLTHLRFVQRVNKALELFLSIQMTLSSGIWGLHASPTIAKGLLFSRTNWPLTAESQAWQCPSIFPRIPWEIDRESILTGMDEHPFYKPRVIVMVKNKNAMLQSTSCFYNCFFPFSQAMLVRCRGAFMYEDPYLRGLKRAAGSWLGCKQAVDSQDSQGRGLCLHPTLS